MFTPKAPEGADPKMYAFLFLLTLGSTVGFQGWTLLYTNFAVQQAHFSAADNGLVQSLREVPGLLSFTVIPLLLLLREHRLAVFAVIATGLGTALTGFFPSFGAVLLTTLLMSFGFHYFETVNQSLMLQYFDLRLAPVIMGRLRGLAAGGSLLTSLFVFLCSDLLSFEVLFLIAGLFCVAMGLACLYIDPSDSTLPVQHKHLVFRAKYWLFYVLTFLMGARRQIVTVFALFLLVEKFDFSVRAVSLLFMVNYTVNWFLNPLIGRCINYIGERKLLSLEYATALVVFFGYAYTDSAFLAGFLYVVDCLVYNFSFAIRTFFQKIAEKSDIAPSMAVAQTVNHVAAVVIPALGGWMWVVWGYRIPFLAGMALTFVSLCVVQLVDREIRRYAVPE